MDQAFGFLGIIAVVVGALLMARRDLKVFPVNLLSHSLWFMNGLLSKNWALVILNILLFGLTCYTWWNFTRNRQWK